MIGIQWLHHEFQFPSSQEPEWSAQVERWYQLDGPAFALTETFWREREKLSRAPVSMLLASPQASNLTDAAFATQAASSPARFVHTLPNIRAASLLQVMGWAGPVICLQNDPGTLISGLDEGLRFAEQAEGDVWVLSVVAGGDRFTGHIFVLSRNSPHATLKLARKPRGTMGSPSPHDKDLIFWLNEPEQAVGPFIANGFEILNSRAL